jgi:dTDP-glucose pyrophosphorylase
MIPTIIMPMAGNGKRFKQAGFKQIKPLINFFNKPMFQHVIDSLGIEGKWIFIVQKKHREKYDLDTILKKSIPNCEIIDTGGGVTEGAACSVLLAKKYIDLHAPLIVINSDNIIDWNSKMYFDMLDKKYDGIIPCFTDNNPKWSFVEINSESFVTRVEEKTPISNLATAGIYIWRQGSFFIKSAEQMISKNIRIKNEFYLCPVFNETIKLGGKVKICMVNKMHSVGTPEDLEQYINYKNNL